jgi:class 3 adenylate cyclase/tetratricopeptide (TPR) repeat protein
VTCPSCGTVCPAEARFCPSCGHSLGAERGDERRLVTILFADLVGYTTLSETRDPEQVKNLVDRCFERLAADVVAYGGRVDKIVGDAIMALFGAPLAHEDDAERAVRAGLQMQRTLADWAQEQGVPFRMRIGVNSGEVLVGALRAGGDYTAMGDVVNTASRLQTAAEPGQVLVGPTTHAATRDVFRFEARGLIQTKGREEAVPAWVALQAVAPPGHRPRRVRTPLIGRDAEIGMLRHVLSLAADRRRAQMVLLTGEAGTGKTRLAEELSELARTERHAIVLEGRCVPYGESNVWWPLAEALRRSVGIAPNDDEEAIMRKGAEVVAALLDLPDDDREVHRVLKGLGYLMHQEKVPEIEPGRARDEAVRALHICLERMTAERPLVFFVAELHWADDLLLEFLDRLLDRVQQLPILLVATARPELAERWHPPAGRHNQVVLHIDPLDHRATADLLDVLLAAPLSRETRDALVERSGGNPLFLEELVALVGTEHALHELPVTLRGLVAARLDALAAGERSTLEDAAVVGRSGSFAALEVMAGAERSAAVPDAVARLFGSDLLASVEPGGWEFCSEVVREVAYGTLTKSARARRHAAYAQWLEGGLGGVPSPGREDLDHLAHHYGTAAQIVLELDGVDGVPSGTGAKALCWLERAAARAEAEELWISAVELLDQAMSLSVFGDEDATRRLLLARARARCGVRDVAGASADVQDALQRARAASDQHAHAQLLVILGEIKRVDGEIAASADTLDEAVALARELGDRQLLADSLRALGQTYLFGGDEAAADAASAEALTLYRDLGDRRGEAWALQSLAWTAFLRGDLGPAEDRLSASAAAFTEISDFGGHSWAMGLLGWVRYSEGRLDEAERLGRSILAEAAGGGDRWAVGMMSTLVANVALWTGRTSDAVRLAREARAQMIDLRDRWGELQAVAPLARGLLALGEIEAGRSLLDEVALIAEEVADVRGRRVAKGAIAIALTQQLGEGPAVLEVARSVMDLDPASANAQERVMLGMALLQSGLVSDALAMLKRAVDPNDSLSAQAHPGSVLALAQLSAGMPEAALATLGRYCPPRAGTYADRAWTAIARAFAHLQMGEGADVEACFDEALEEVGRTEDRLTEAALRLARSIALEAAGSPSAARAAVEAADSLTALGVALPGWQRVFRLAAGASPARDEVALAT